MSNGLEKCCCLGELGCGWHQIVGLPIVRGFRVPSGVRLCGEHLAVLVRQVTAAAQERFHRENPDEVIEVNWMGRRWKIPRRDLNYLLSGR